MNIPEDWEQVYLYKDWFITIGTDDKLCFSSFEFFEEHRDLVAKSQCVFMGEVFDIMITHIRFIILMKYKCLKVIIALTFTG